MAFNMRSIDRRAVLLGLAATGSAVSPVLAESGRQIMVTVPYPAGGPLDTVARLITQTLQATSSDIYVVENKAGANGNIGALRVAHSRSDGSSWLFASDALLDVNPFLYAQQAGADLTKELRVVGSVGSLPSILVVNPQSAFKSVQEFIAYAKTHEVNYASGGVGSAGHLTMEYFGSLAGLKLRHIPYKGGAPAMTDLMGGHVDAAFVAIGGAIQYVKAGQLRALAVSSKKRLPTVSEVPTVKELGYQDFEVETAYFVWVPVKTRDAEVAKAGETLSKVVADESVSDKLRAQGVNPTSMNAAESDAWLARETKRWSALIKDRHIGAE